MIEISKMGFQYSGSDRMALRDINLTIQDGEFVGLIGVSGAGKTSLTHTLTGMIPHHYKGDFYGSVRVNGMDTVECRGEDLYRIVGSVFQDIDSQMVASVVEDEILYGLENFGFSREEISERLENVLDTLGIRDLRYRALSSLSGGQKQKVAIAAIVALRPQIIVLDEPTGELDPESSLQIFRLLRQLNKEFGITVLIVEQKIMLLCEYVDRMIVMNEGAIVFDGPARDVVRHTSTFEDIGINVPRVVTLCGQLQKKGLYNGQVPLNVEEGEKMVREVLRGGRHAGI
ncbi:MAG TPA: ATP-binding cassette domain-containing protein [Firmicutes bacterium]|nr:ATP-binding cassette domain-containing protein [Bacillota bacterium]